MASPIDVEMSDSPLVRVPEDIKSEFDVLGSEAVPNADVAEDIEKPREDSIVYTQITLDSPDPRSDEADDGTTRCF